MDASSTTRERSWSSDVASAARRRHLRSATFLALVALLACPRAGTGQTLRGTVLDAATGRVVPLASVIVLAQDSDSVVARTVAEAGAFQLRLNEAGAYRIRVESLGYATVPGTAVSVPPGASVTVELRLRVDAVPLEPLRVIAERREPWWLADIRERQRLGFGTFLYREDLDQRADSELEDVLRSTGGIAIEYVKLPGGTARTVPLVVMRRSSVTAVRNCYSKLFVNGNPYFIREDVDALTLNNIRDFMDIRPADIEAIEIYRGPAETPAEYAIWEAGQCGVVALWLRTEFDPAIGPERFVPPPRVRVAATGGSHAVAGPFAPERGTSFGLNVVWLLRPHLAIELSTSTGVHTLPAAAANALTIELERGGWREQGFIVPPGARPQRLIMVALGPRAELRSGRIRPLLGARVNVVRRQFLVEHEAVNRDDARFTSWGAGVGAVAGVNLGLVRGITLHMRAERDWTHMLPYSRLDRPDMSTAGVWTGAALRAGLAYEFGGGMRYRR